MIPTITNGGVSQTPAPPAQVELAPAAGARQDNGDPPQIPVRANVLRRPREHQLDPPSNGGEDCSVGTANLRPRRKQRNVNSGESCCNCNRSSGCTNAPQLTCCCPRAQPPQWFTNCALGARCQNLTPLDPAEQTRRGPLDNFFVRGAAALCAPVRTIPPATSTTMGEDQPTVDPSTTVIDPAVVAPAASGHAEGGGGEGEIHAKNADNTVPGGTDGRGGAAARQTQPTGERR